MRTLYRIIGSQVEAFQGKIWAFSKRKIWYTAETDGNCTLTIPQRRKWDNVRRQRNVPCSLKWRFHWCFRRQQGWNCQQYWNVINHWQFYLFTPSAFCFLGRKCDQTCEVRWRMRQFHNKTIAVSCSDGGKPANKTCEDQAHFPKCFFSPPRHQLLDRIWKILQGWNWNMLIGEWQQLSAGATSLCNSRLFLTTCHNTQKLRLTIGNTDWTEQTEPLLSWCPIQRIKNYFFNIEIK